jgi:Cytochrome c3
MGLFILEAFTMKNTTINIIILSVLFLNILMAQDSVIVIDETKIDLTKLPKGDNCISCHIEDENMPAGFSDNDIHLQAGLSCAGCHGGDPAKDDADEAMSEKAGFIGVPDRKDIPNFCGKCHSDIRIMREYQPRINTDQVSQYYTSVHGMNFKKGDTHVATCISCHTSHRIMSAKDPRSTVHALNIPSLCNSCHGDKEYMSEYKIPTNQFEQYKKSVHGVALLEREDTGAPACNDCHGNHGATPPGITLAKVCGTCHVQNEEYFSKTRMAEEFQKEELHACLECHGTHNIDLPTDDMIGITEESICLDCHQKADRGYVVADSINTMLKNTVAAYDSAIVKQKEVQIIGMDDVDMNFLLQDAHQSLIHSRTLVHTFNPKQVKEKTDQSIEYSEKASSLGTIEIENYSTRRLGLGIATLFITILVISLIFKIKEIDKEKGV